jgi:hypothetical protein
VSRIGLVERKKQRQKGRNKRNITEQEVNRKAATCREKQNWECHKNEVWRKESLERDEERNETKKIWRSAI